MDFRRNFSTGRNVNILLILVRLLTMQCTRSRNILPFLHDKENSPCYDNSHKKCFSVATIARYVAIILTRVAQSEVKCSTPTPQHNTNEVWLSTIL